MEWIYVITTGLSSLAAIFAWLAKILWSKEFQDATNQIIKAKDAQIEQLHSSIEQYKELNPSRLREYHLSLRTELEEYNFDTESCANTYKKLKKLYGADFE